MAREKMVTRTVDITEVEVMVCNVESCEVQIVTYKLTGIFKNTEDIMKKLRKEYETDSLKMVAIQNTSIFEVLYGMTELEFIKLAKVLPPRVSKANTESEVIENDN
jgi:hypothetical protein